MWSTQLLLTQSSSQFAVFYGIASFLIVFNIILISFYYFFGQKKGIKWHFSEASEQGNKRARSGYFTGAGISQMEMSMKEHNDNIWSPAFWKSRQAIWGCLWKSNLQQRAFLRLSWWILLFKKYCLRAECGMFHFHCITSRSE